MMWFPNMTNITITLNDVAAQHDPPRAVSGHDADGQVFGTVLRRDANGSGSDRLYARRAILSQATPS